MAYEATESAEAESRMDAEALLGLLPCFRSLRPDESARVAAKMQRIDLAVGQTLDLDPSSARLVVVAEGQVALARDAVSTTMLFAGDSLGDVEVVSARGQPGRLTAQVPSSLLTLTAADLNALFDESPAIALAFVADLGRELRWRNDFLREICLARAAGLPPAFLSALLARSRRRLQRHRYSSARRVAALLYRVVFKEPSRRPAFWIFAGVGLALLSARTVVAVILRHGLQEKLFALIESGAGHPMHVHHFNYGLILMSIAGLLSLLPSTRRYLRVLSFAFGFGMGLVVDEFALFWNLNPDYYQASSRLVALGVLFVLTQIVYFRPVYATIGRRFLARTR